MLITEITSRPLDEEFLSHLNYDLFGWIEPGGKLLLASVAQAHSSKTYYHEVMIGEKGYRSKKEAFAAGWVRWFVQRNTLYMQTSKYINEELIKTISKGVKNIEKVAQNPAKISHFQGPMAKKGQAIFIMQYHLDATGFSETTDTFKKLLDYMKYNLTPESKEIWE